MTDIKRYTLCGTGMIPALAEDPNGEWTKFVPLSEQQKSIFQAIDKMVDSLDMTWNEKGKQSIEVDDIFNYMKTNFNSTE